MNGFIVHDGFLSVPLYVPVANYDLPPAAPPPPYAALAGPPNPPIAGPRIPVRPHPFHLFGPLPLPPAALPAAPVAAPPPAPPAAAAPPAADEDYPPGTHFDGSRDGLPAGTSYLFPKKHTTVYVVKGSFDPLANPRTEFDFWMFKVPTILTVGDLIHQLGARTGGSDKCGVTELLEVGDGSWAKGVTIFLNDDNQKKQALAALGWDETRGAAKPPVWLKLHKG
ncbi:hypothetical protein GP486_008648 [Trichoglossum hirsutum]|uniref:Uncharacterized protein n=1 Tax=Trichoglossum hirsutum TaxID=265104 RepID=A0A9P8IBC1_9PEZI|nr:hypothetical protein GP486_008648 [Trichoglossum hirsutum]